MCSALASWALGGLSRRPSPRVRGLAWLQLLSRLSASRLSQWQQGRGARGVWLRGRHTAPMPARLGHARCGPLPPACHPRGPGPARPSLPLSRAPPVPPGLRVPAHTAARPARLLVEPSAGGLHNQDYRTTGLGLGLGLHNHASRNRLWDEKPGSVCDRCHKLVSSPARIRTFKIRYS